MPNCEKCNADFEITPLDWKFYQRIHIPEPRLCPDCRNRRRMSWRNEKTLYKRQCDLCKKNIISIYSSEKPFPVYCQECFWGDKWNALDFGQDFNFERSFSEQFQEFMNKAPRLAIVNKQSENSDYCNYSFANKNCYLTFGNHYEEDCMYGRYSTKNKFCLDYLFTYGSELCYENTFSKNCYESVYVDHCDNCQNCYFSRNLTGCKNCLFCSNLKHKEYHILNKPYSKEEYEAKLKEAALHTYPGFQKAAQYFLAGFTKQFPLRATYQVNCEHCEGDNLNNCKNVYRCFDCTNCEDIAYAVQIDETYDSMDMTCMGYDKSEVCYETIGCSGIFNCVACDSCWHNSDLLYCNLCFSSKNCFGCISLQHKENCIFNKQYSKQDYEVMKEKIRSHMQKTGEWGEFFYTKVSPYAYNETIANEYFPLSQEEATKNHWQWKEVEDKIGQVSKTIPADKLPDTIGDIPDDVLNWAIVCKQSGRPFKIQKQELSFYRKLNLPLPHYHPDIRFEKRMARRRPRRLNERKCDQCGSDMQASCPADYKGKVYCEHCFLKSSN